MGSFFPPVDGGGGTSGVLVPAAGKVPKAYGDSRIDGNWLGRKTQSVWVSPTGSNSNQGTELAPFKTLAFAVQTLYGSGGIVNLCNNSHWTDGTEPAGAWGSQLSTGQGVYLSQSAFIRPGFWIHSGQILVQGVPEIQSEFGTVPKATLIAGNTYLSGAAANRGDPVVWLDNMDGSITFRNIQFNSSADTPVRLGFDYARDSAGDIISSFISSAVRTGSAAAAAGGPPAVTVLTLTGIPTYNIVSLTRAGGLTRAIIAGAANQLGNFNITDNVIHLVSSDGNFPTGDYHVQTDLNFFNQVVFIDSNSPASASAGAVGTISGTGAGQRDRVTLVNTSGSAQYPSGLRKATTLKVIASTYNTITVQDPYGGFDGRTDGTFTNIGNLITELRSLTGTGNLAWDNIGAASNAVVTAGPAFDVAKSIGFAFTLSNFNGLAGSGVAACRNPDEAAYLLADGSSFGPVINLNQGRVSNGQIRVWTSAGAGQSTVVNGFLQDSGTGTIPPAVEFIDQANAFASTAIVTLSDIGQADDGDSDTSAVSLLPQFDPARVTVNNVSLFNGGIEGGPYTGFNAFARGQTGPTAYGALTFDGKRVTAQQDTARRAAPLQAGNAVRNLFNIDLSAWTTHGSITVTPGQSHPDGVSTAYKLVGTGSLNGLAFDGRQMARGTINYAVGDQFILGCWVRREDTGTPADFNVMTLNGTGMTAYARSDEWQWVSKVMTPPAPDLIDLAINGLGASTAMWMRDPVMIFIPVASALDANELAEVMIHLGPSDANLLPGTVGTGRGQALQVQGQHQIPSTAPLVVGAGSGQVTLTGSSKYYPIYDQSGALLGFFPVAGGSINP